MMAPGRPHAVCEARYPRSECAAEEARAVREAGEDRPRSVAREETTGV